MGLVHVDESQDEKALWDAALLEEPLHFKTTATWIVEGQVVKDYPQVPPNWYRNTTEQSHVFETD